MTLLREAPAAPHWPEAVVFDLDGTLVHSAPDIAAALNVVLARHGLPALSLDAVTRMIGGGVPKLIERALDSLVENADGVEAADIVAAFLTVYETCATDRTELYPGVRPVLERFAEAGVRMGVCTNKPTAISRRILEELGVAGFIGAVVGGDSGLERKPHPAPLHAVLQDLDISADAAVMVGDSAADVGAARAAGLAVVLVTFGYTQTPAEELGGDRVITRFDALEDALADLRSAGRRLSRSAG